MQKHKITRLLNVRLPSWVLPENWPRINDEPALASIEIENSRFISLAISDPAIKEDNNKENTFDMAGRLALPALVDAHTHLDKTFTRQRLGSLSPGLLAAIVAMKEDQRLWNKEDLSLRIDQALIQSTNHGVSYLRSHIDWVDDNVPLAWDVLADHAKMWKSKLRLQRVALVPLPLLTTKSQVMKIANAVKSSDDAIMGAFIHSSNFNADAIHWLIQAADELKLDLDLHIDEELNPEAKGLACLLDALETTQFSGRVVCGHVCALSQKGDSEALKLLDRIAKQPITLVALPATNLLLQDAITDRTPRQRGLTLVHEAKARSIPVLFASDNVQDAFCAFGDYDPVEALRLGVYSAHLNNAFDEWSQSICRKDWLNQPEPYFNLIGLPANLCIFDTTTAACWPNNEERHLLQNGQWIEPSANRFLSTFHCQLNSNTTSGISHD